jgi:hypothetical protein
MEHLATPLKPVKSQLLYRLSYGLFQGLRRFIKPLGSLLARSYRWLVWVLRGRGGTIRRSYTSHNARDSLFCWSLASGHAIGLNPQELGRDTGVTAMPSTEKLIVVAVLAAFVIWRLVLALSRGRLKLFDPFFWAKADNASLFDGRVVTRDGNPFGFWFGVVFQILLSSLFFWIFISMYLQRISQ